MKRYIKTVIASMIMALGLFAGPLLVTATAAAAPATNTPKESVCEGISAIDGGDACGKKSKAGDALPDLIKNIINLLLFLVGVAAVVMIIISGFNYVVSNGDQSKVTTAKNTLLYSVVGLVVAAMAFAIVNFVVDNI